MLVVREVEALMKKGLRCKRSKVRKKATKSQLARWMAAIGGLRMRLEKVAALLFVFSNQELVSLPAFEQSRTLFEFHVSPVD
jgi:hypothetical protein